MTITAEDWQRAKVATLNSSLGRPSPAYWKSIQPPDVGSPGPRSSPMRRCSSMSDCEAKKTGKKKGSFDWRHGDHGGRGPGPLWERVSSVTGRKLTLTSWLPSKTRPGASAGYFHGASKKTETHSLLVIHLYWNELHPPPPDSARLVCGEYRES